MSKTKQKPPQLSRQEWNSYEKAVLEGLESGPGREVTSEFWEEKRRRLIEEYGSGTFEPPPP